MDYSLGFKDLDNVIAGTLSYPYFAVIGSRPGVGKTSFMLNCALDMQERGNKVCFISLESDKDVLELRCQGIHEAWGSETDKKLEILTHYMSFNDLIDTIEDRAREGFTVFFIETLQLLNSYRKDTYEEASYIAVKLKSLSHSLGVVIIASSQLTRQVESRTGHRPIMNDLRDSGALEECADLVMLILRRNYYDPNDKPGQAEIIVAKNRNGEIGSVNLTFTTECGAFYNYEPVNYCMKSEDDSEIFRPFDKK